MLQRQVQAKVQNRLSHRLNKSFTFSLNFCNFFKFQIASKRDAEQEREAQNWIETILGEKFKESYEDSLRDGQILCHLINKLAPGSVNKINTTGAQFKLMENIQKFQKACIAYGVNEVDVFQTVDLWEKKDISQVTTTIYALGRTVSSFFLS